MRSPEQRRHRAEKEKTETNHKKKNTWSQAGCFLPGEVKPASAVGDRDHTRERRGGEARRGRLPEDGGVVFECLNGAGAPTADQRQRSGWALSGIKSR